MAIADLKSVLKIFGGSDVSDEERHELYKEVLCMTLSRAADADINIQNVEVDRIREILKEHTGEDFSAGKAMKARKTAKPRWIARVWVSFQTHPTIKGKGEAIHS